MRRTNEGGPAVATLICALLCVSICVLSACSSSGPSATVPTATSARSVPSSAAAIANRVPAALERISRVVALGDSVPYGNQCRCTPYPPLTAASIARITGHKVTDANDSEPGFRSHDVLHQVKVGRKAIADITRADLVTVEIGANDVSFSAKCKTNVACYKPKLLPLIKNITATVARIRQLTAGHHVVVVLLDYWNVWLGGQVAKARGPVYVHAADSVTNAVSAAIQSVARSTHSLYVDLRVTFRGPAHDRDETNLLASDGDHPNAAGHRRIAAAIVKRVGAF